MLVGGHVALLGVYLIASGPFRGAGSTIVILLLLGGFYAATDGVLPALVSRLIAADTRGSGIAAAQTVVVVARFTSSVAFGGLWVLLGPRQALMLLAALLGGALPVAAWLLRASDHRAERSPA